MLIPYSLCYNLLFSTVHHLIFLSKQLRRTTLVPFQLQTCASHFWFPNNNVWLATRVEAIASIFSRHCPPQRWAWQKVAKLEWCHLGRDHIARKREPKEQNISIKSKNTALCLTELFAMVTLVAMASNLFTEFWSPAWNVTCPWLLVANIAPSSEARSP